MTAKEAAALGYAVIKASDFEVGLVKGERGIRTWWAKDFDRKLPELDHPLIMHAIRLNEELVKDLTRLMGRPPGP